MAKPRYSFAIRLYRDKADPQAIGEFIEDLIAEKNEFVNEDGLVAAARPSASPLHPCFTWNENEAADKCRRREARNLVKALRIENDAGKKTEALQYVHHPMHGGKRVLMSAHSVAITPWAKEEVSLRGALMLQQQLKSWISRFGADPETRALAKDVKSLQKRIQRELMQFA